ncbi:TPA: FERM, RhoGEF and pleckstrin domain protein 2-like [Bos taurus]|nr:TPA: FERM, RhoGEF and pleckstrin domain protein 2-like [Bos taurus]
MTLLHAHVSFTCSSPDGHCVLAIVRNAARGEESSSTQATGSHQRIGDILLRNMLQLKERYFHQNGLSSGHRPLRINSAPQGCLLPGQGSSAAPLRAVGPVQLLLLRSRPYAGSPRHQLYLRPRRPRSGRWESEAPPGSPGSAPPPEAPPRSGPGAPFRLKALTGHFQRLHEVLTELEAASRRLRRLEALRRDFELQKVCYLPLNAFLLKPLQRLRHYRLLLRRLCAPVPGHPDPHGQDHADLRDALQAITEVTSMLQHSLVQLENLQKLTELQRDLVGIESLVAPGRELIREGCLHKLSRKGLQQRMFFLVGRQALSGRGRAIRGHEGRGDALGQPPSWFWALGTCVQAEQKQEDMLLYTSRDAGGSSHFRIRGLLPLHGMLHPQDQAWSSSTPPANPKESCPLAGKPMESLRRALGPQRGWRDGADTTSKGES